MCKSRKFLLELYYIFEGVILLLSNSYKNWQTIKNISMETIMQSFAGITDEDLNTNFSDFIPLCVGDNFNFSQ